MIEHTIPCETFARLSNLLKYNPIDDPWCNSIRLEGGYAIVTNRFYIVVEKIDCANHDVLHVPLDPQLIEVCRSESAYHSKLHITAVPAMKYASCKSSMGYPHGGNAGLWLDTENRVDAWRSKIPTSLPKKTTGSMYLELDGVKALLETAPSGRIAFQDYIDWSQPVVVNDVVDGNWFAVFHIRKQQDLHNSARVPGWFK